MSGKATWIWSFGDFELFHHRKLSLKADGKTVQIETDAEGGHYVKNGERVKLVPNPVNRFDG